MDGSGRLSLDEFTRDLEALKFRLAAMEAADLPETEAGALAAEISAIRLHLKRLALDRKAVAEAIARAAPRAAS